MKKFILKENMDVIEIYKEGKFEEFKEAYSHLEEDLTRLMNLRMYFMKTYYSSLKVKEGPKEYKNGILVIDNEEDIKRRENIFNDEYFPEFDSLAGIYLGEKNHRIMIGKGKPNEFVPDENGKLFYNKYLCKGYRRINVKTTLDEAIAFNNPDIINFIKSFM